MTKKIIVTVVVIILGYFLIDSYYIKNMHCKSENGWYQVHASWGSSTPIDITERVKNGECECINEFLFVEKKPIQFTEQQLSEIKKNLPNWALENCKNFSLKDKINLENELNKTSSQNFKESLKYRYTFYLFVGNVPVYTIKIKNITAYCPNYSYVYNLYDGKYAPKNHEKDPFGKKPNYPIIECEVWAKTKFGDRGI